MNFDIEFLRKRKPIMADPNWESQLSSADLVRERPDLAANFGMIPVQSLVQKEADPTEPVIEAQPQAD